jgi:hypothetical protein
MFGPFNDPRVTVDIGGIFGEANCHSAPERADAIRHEQVGWAGQPPDAANLISTSSQSLPTPGLSGWARRPHRPLRSSRSLWSCRTGRSLWSCWTRGAR